MLRAFGSAFVRYHVGLSKMPRKWKPWLFALLTANMIAPWFFITHVEAQIVFIVALLNGATFVALTAMTGFSRLLGLGHLWWIPLVIYLGGRADLYPVDTPIGIWIRAVIVLDCLSMVLDAINVYLYIKGDREEMVEGLLPELVIQDSGSQNSSAQKS